MRSGNSDHVPNRGMGNFFAQKMPHEEDTENGTGELCPYIEDGIPDLNLPKRKNVKVTEGLMCAPDCLPQGE